MRFSIPEIELAHQLKASGLVWHPAVGHFVWDGEELIDAFTPFHDRVYFILELKHFLRRTGTIERLAESMVWLPTWEQAREHLRVAGVPDDAILHRLQETDALRQATERRELYQMMLDQQSRLI